MGKLRNSAVRLLDRAAALWPDRPAIDDGDAHFSYAQYRDQAQAAGTALLREGPKPVVVWLPKSALALTVFMGALYAGVPYVPVDAAIPLSRLTRILESMSPCYLVTNEALAGGLPQPPQGVTVRLGAALASGTADREAIDRALDRVTDTDPIYVMFTSGSTGVPKGVVIPHRGILDYADWLIETFGFTPETVMASQAPFYFDNSTFDIYGCLRCGGRLLLTPESLFLFPSKLPQYLAENQVTSIFWVPTVMINVANSGALAQEPLPKLKNVAFCGEVMPNKQLNIWRQQLPHASFANLYGPTEITDVCCYYRVDRPFRDEDPLPIGIACENMRVLLLTEEGREAAPGQQGELCVVGSGVALGYWGAAELTQRAFVQNPLNPHYQERMYRTGDLALWGQDGLLRFLGRRDSQIKLKGNRIELGDIETAAMCVEGVENACAVFDGESQTLALYVETKGTLPPRRFNMALKQYIPTYMLPSRLFPMEKLPHTANDKIDRVLLRQMLREALNKGE